MVLLFWNTWRNYMLVLIHHHLANDTYTINGYTFKNNDKNGTLWGVDLYCSEKFKEHVTAADDMKELEYVVNCYYSGYVMDHNDKHKN